MPMVDTSLGELGACVAVQFKALPKESKLYLEKVLQDWLAWHRRSFPSEVTLKANLPVVSGVLEFVPSLLPSDSDAVPLAWVDKPGRSPSPQRSKLGFNLSYEMVGDVPKYDCSSEQPLDAQDAERRAAERIEGSGRTMYVASAPRRSRPRCFNCGSYYHALKDCLQSKDTEAISRARSEQQERGRGGSVSGRYFLQASSAGAEFSDLQPGMLSETLRAAMGLKPEDPPPWLFRMRQMGYPPGYRRQNGEESDEEVIIIGDDSPEERVWPPASGSPNSNGDVSEAEDLVVFPGLNAPIPPNADPALWFGQPTEPLVNGMTPEERGFKRGRSGGGGDSEEHAAKRTRFWESRLEMPPEAQAALQRLQALAQPNQGTQYSSSAPPQPAAPVSHGAPSYFPYTPTYPYPQAVQHPYGQQPQPPGSQQWAASQQQPVQQGAFTYHTPPPMHPTYTPLPQATPPNGAPALPFHQLPNGFPGGQPPGSFHGSFQGAAAGAYFGGHGPVPYPATPDQPYSYLPPGSLAMQPPQQQQQQFYNNGQWAAHSMQFQAAVEEPPPPPPPG